jgi:hypothetical protein
MIIIQFRKWTFFIDEIPAAIISAAVMFIVISSVQLLFSGKKKTEPDGSVSDVLKIRGGDRPIYGIAGKLFEDGNNYVINDSKLFKLLTKLFKCGSGKTVISVTLGALIAGYIVQENNIFYWASGASKLIISRPKVLKRAFLIASVFLGGTALVIRNPINMILFCISLIQHQATQQLIKGNYQKLPNYNGKYDFLNVNADVNPKIILHMENAKEVLRIKPIKGKVYYNIGDVILGSGNNDLVLKTGKALEEVRKIIPLHHRTKTLNDLRGEITAEAFDKAIDVVTGESPLKEIAERIKNI